MSNSKNIDIKGRTIGPGSPCFIIAEAGVNHNGDIMLAQEMIDAASEAGADCIKFQTFKAEEFVSEATDIFEYVSQGETVRESQLEMFKRLEIEYSKFEGLFKRAEKKGLIPLSTPADRTGADLLFNLGAGAYKIGSDDLIHTPFLEYVAKKQRPMILSTGMADKKDIDRAIKVIRSIGQNDICLLHCTSIYPTPLEEINLRKILTFQKEYNLPVGFSDHSEGILAALGAVALGASVIEKHFTLDKNLSGPDHHFSMDPDELCQLVKNTRGLELSIGRAEIAPTPGELQMRKIARRSIVAASNLKEGHVLTIDDLGFQRPGSGLPPYDIQLILGKKLKRAMRASDQITLDNVI